MGQSKKLVISITISLFCAFALSSNLLAEYRPLLHSLICRGTLLLLILSPFYLIPVIRQKLDSFLFSRFKDFDIFLMPLATCLIFGELYQLWDHQITGNNYTAGGVIPLVDSKDYFQGAMGLNENGTLHDWAGRRPLNHLFFGGLFYWVGDNHFIAFQLLSSFIVLGATVFANLISRHINKLAAFYSIIAIFYFYRFFIGSFLSESLGLAMSLISVILLINSRVSGKDRIQFVALSIFALAFGLSARAGNFFAPAMILLAYSFLGQFKIKKAYAIGIMLVAMFLGFSSNKLVRSYYSIEGSAASNLGYTLYGIARGGAGWTQFSRDYPKLNATLVGQAHIDAVNEKIKESILNEPFLFVKGCFKSLKLYLRSYLTFLPGKFKYLEFFFLLFFVISILRKKGQGFIHPLWIGTVLVFLTNIMVAPLLAGDGEQRVFAGTICFTILMFAKGFEKLKSNQADSNEMAESIQHRYGNMAMLVVPVFLVFTPMILAKAKTIDKGVTKTCEKGSQLSFYYRKDYSFHYVVDKEVRYEMRPKAVNRNLLEKLMLYTNFGGVNQNLKDDKEYTLFAAIDIEKKRYSLEKLYNFPKDISNGFYQFCIDNHELISHRKL